MSNSTTRLALYLLCSAAVVAAMFAIYLAIIKPEVISGGGTAGFVSQHGRIRIAEVHSFTTSHKMDGQSSSGPMSTLSSVYVPSYLPDGFSHSQTRLLTESSAGQLFEGRDTTLVVVQSPVLH